VIDLHTHTTASDGRFTPRELVSQAAAAGVTILSVTDHDTVAACAQAAGACADAGLEFVPGIEITAVLDRADVHVLGYFLDVRSPPLLAFLAEQRRRRLDRVREIALRLASLGMPLDVDAILRPGLDDAGRAAGRPWIARALVEAGYVESTNAAFHSWLARGRPAYVPRVGAAPAEVFARIHAADGLASLAHPGLTAVDEWIPEFVDMGLDAIEAYHSRHDLAATGRYLALADHLHVLVTGGSDFHGDGSHGPASPGSVSLPRQAFDTLAARSRPW
jgi:predicted metal-dependent phosphoesterase TrpH